jgi:hydrogenase maturation protease
MFSDEGVGVHLSRLLQRKYHFVSAEHTIDIIDGGTLAQLLTPIIVRYDYCVIFDCISVDSGKAGDVYFFDYEDIPRGVNWHGSAHEVETLQTLAMMDLLGDRPRVKIVGVVPQRTDDTTLELSAVVQEGAVVMEKTAVKHLMELGFSVETLEPALTIARTAREFGRDD